MSACRSALQQKVAMHFTGFNSIRNAVFITAAMILIIVEWKIIESSISTELGVLLPLRAKLNDRNIGCEPADLTVHPPPPRTAEGEFIVFA